MEKTKGSFTLPGEAGYEELTLKLAERWGADVIRDSDGTELSEEITGAGYGIYSTICLIRDHNEWAKAHPDQLQQTFLVTDPKTAFGGVLTFDLMEDFFTEQFTINDSPEALTGRSLTARRRRRYPAPAGVMIKTADPWYLRKRIHFMTIR